MLNKSTIYTHWGNHGRRRKRNDVWRYKTYDCRW
jgi:hypothetical protein